MEMLGVYVQIPFCASKCSFCNFSSQVARQNTIDAYCRALEREIEHLPVLYRARGIGEELFSLPVDTVYVGGGSPSIVGGGRLQRIFQDLPRRFSLGSLVEFTLEVTPGSGVEDWLAKIVGLGVNRLSIGAQSFEDQELRAVGRLHSAAATQDLARAAGRAGFSNINVDLIAGLPYQTANSWCDTLRAAAQLKPKHVSVYLFEVDEKSRLGREVLRRGNRYHAEAVPQEGFLVEAYETARDFLRGEGYLHYEISNFALPGYESRHNLKYWELKPYVGLGAGAHSFDGGRRWANETAPDVYTEKLAHGESPVAEIRRLSPEEQLEEFFFLGLRQRAGVDLACARDRWGTTMVSRWEPIVSELARAGWLEKRGERVCLTEQAYLVSNEIFQEFLVA
jgi:oxygen-independent coproporphyrinogen-3 oxidase